MLRITSTNAASYLTTVTEIEAQVMSRGNGNYYGFPRNAAIMNAYNDYRQAQKHRQELNVDLIKFNENFDSYRRLTRNKKRER